MRACVRPWHNSIARAEHRSAAFERSIGVYRYWRWLGRQIGHHVAPSLQPTCEAAPLGGEHTCGDPAGGGTGKGQGIVGSSLGQFQRRREMDICETRCRVALLQVYWEQVEEMGRWTVGMMQWRLNKMIFRQPQWNWDRGWLQLRAREEAAKLWVRAGVHGLGIACWQVRGCVGRRARAVRIVGRIVVLLPYVDAGTIERT